jgi:hypothetical protein
MDRHSFRNSESGVRDAELELYTEKEQPHVESVGPSSRTGCLQMGAVDDRYARTVRSRAFRSGVARVGMALSRVFGTARR